MYAVDTGSREDGLPPGAARAAPQPGSRAECSAPQAVMTRKRLRSIVAPFLLSTTG
jgi:hypothetical protein